MQQSVQNPRKRVVGVLSKSTHTPRQRCGTDPPPLLLLLAVAVHPHPYHDAEEQRESDGLQTFRPLPLPFATTGVPVPLARYERLPPAAAAPASVAATVTAAAASTVSAASTASVAQPAAPVGNDEAAAVRGGGRALRVAVQSRLGGHGVHHRRLRLPGGVGLLPAP